jgi:hypothetical protein
MRKVMLLAAMLAMVLAAAAPVFAQVESEVGDENEGNVSTAQYVDCSQVQAAIQAQYGNASAEADDDSDAVAAVATEQGITFNQANACLGEINDLNQGNDNVGDVVVDENGSAVAVAEASAAAEADAAAAAGSAAAGSAAAATETLPETGGASLLALGAGALLVAGGLLARRIVR